tara:strand:+ start:1311 stop:2237 length:927 start_codon:yes stop_codon:yes gene_type:complete
MKVLIVGYGSHTKRRIIPGIKKINLVNQIDLLTDIKLAKNEMGEIKIINNDNLKNIKTAYDLILISSYPTKHIDLFKKVRSLGYKFIIEKPITNKLVSFINNDFDVFFKDKLVYESNAFLYHPIYQEVEKIIKQKNIKKLVCSFTIPQLDKNNFRYKKELGGSSILDQGVYPITLITELFKENIQIKKYKIIYDKKLDLDTSGILIAKAFESIEIELSWGINQEYKNELRIYDDKKEFFFPFIFSKPENHTSNYFEINQGKKNEFLIGNFDQFQIMYENILLKPNSNSPIHIDKLKYKYSFIKNLLGS